MKTIHRAVFTDDELAKMERLFGALTLSPNFTHDSVNQHRDITTTGQGMVSTLQIKGRKEMTYSDLWRLRQVMWEALNEMYKRTDYGFWEQTFPNRDLVPHSTLTGMVEQSWRDVNDLTEMALHVDDAMRLLQEWMSEEEES